METSFEYQYRLVSVRHLPELQQDIDHVKSSNRISDHPIYKDYIDKLGFSLPDDFPEAKAMVVVAHFTPAAVVNFRLNGVSREVIIPGGYYHSGIKREDLQREILTHVIGNPDARLAGSETVHHKLLAVRSGLGRYGRNNICYVGDMGSFITLFTFFTDQVFEQDDWNELRFLDACEKCRVCLKNCPTGAIRSDDMLIDAGRCLTLFNEIDGPFPEWIPPGAHNALLGCTRCQWPCPANRQALRRIRRFEDVTEEETRKFLGDHPDRKTLETICGKLHMPHMLESTEVQSILTRNLRALMLQSEN